MIKPNVLIFSGVLISIFALVLDGFALGQSISESIFAFGFVVALFGVVLLVFFAGKSKEQTGRKIGSSHWIWLVGFLMCTAAIMAKKLFVLPDTIDILFKAGVGVFILGVALPLFFQLRDRHEKHD